MPKGSAGRSTALVRELRSLLEGRSEAMIADVEELASLESPSRDQARIAALAAVLARRWRGVGAEVVEHDAPGAGRHLEIRFRSEVSGAERRGALVLCHMDTVHPVGSLERNPVRREGERLYGPGVQDMKGGMVIAYHAVTALHELGIEPAADVTVLITADEETGSVTSRSLIEECASTSRYALVMEPAGSQGQLKTARKGVAAYELLVTGVPAHAGLDFEAGVNAIVELARLVLDASALTDLDAGTTVNVGVMRGGTVSNVVAERAEAIVDARFWTMDEARRVDRAMTSLSVRPEAQLEVTGGINRTPLERGEANLELYRAAREIAAQIDYPLDESSVGGASDGNLTSGAGLATLDGLGAVGAGLHTNGEWIDVTHLAPRAALTAALLATL